MIKDLLFNPLATKLYFSFIRHSEQRYLFDQQDKQLLNMIFIIPRISETKESHKSPILLVYASLDHAAIYNMVRCWFVASREGEDQSKPRVKRIHL